MESKFIRLLKVIHADENSREVREIIINVNSIAVIQREGKGCTVKLCSGDDLLIDDDFDVLLSRFPEDSFYY